MYTLGHQQPDTDRTDYQPRNSVCFMGYLSDDEDEGLTTDYSSEEEESEQEYVQFVDSSSLPPKPEVRLEEEAGPFGPQQVVGLVEVALPTLGGLSIQSIRSFK